MFHECDNFHKYKSCAQKAKEKFHDQCLNSLKGAFKKCLQPSSSTVDLVKISIVKMINYDHHLNKNKKKCSADFT